MPNTRFYVPLLGAAVFVYAWGPHPMASERLSAPRARQEQAQQARQARQAQQQRAEPLSPALDVAVGGDDVRFALNVVNNGRRRVEVRFPDARTHDFAVMDSTGREIWRWSEGRLFTQTMQNKVVDSRETITFDASWKPSRAGRYVAVARLASANHPLQARTAFRVR